MAYVFPDFEQVKAVHRDQIERYGGMPGLRDEGLLRSAIATAQATFGGNWLHEFPHGMAAALAFHIISNHPFLDGNKRTGFATALMFLRLNGYRLEVEHSKAEEFVLSTARGDASKQDVIEFFRRYVRE